MPFQAAIHLIGSGEKNEGQNIHYINAFNNNDRFIRLQFKNGNSAGG